jgi:hypothetical protein
MAARFMVDIMPCAAGMRPELPVHPVFIERNPEKAR